MEEAIQIENPHILIFTRDGELETDILVQEGDNYRHFAIMITDAVRHIADAFKVDESLVWLWVDKERYHPTSPIIEVKTLSRCRENGEKRGEEA